MQTNYKQCLQNTLVWIRDYNEKIKESGRNIAKTILQQLGGNKFIAMTGAKNLGSTNKSLQFKIGRNSKSISHVIITLKSSDLYEMEFIRQFNKKNKLKRGKGLWYNPKTGVELFRNF